MAATSRPYDGFYPGTPVSLTLNVEGYYDIPDGALAVSFICLTSDIYIRRETANTTEIWPILSSTPLTIQNRNIANKRVYLFSANTTTVYVLVLPGLGS